MLSPFSSAIQFCFQKEIVIQDKQGIVSRLEIQYNACTTSDENGDMAQITFQETGEEIIVECGPDETILETSLANGLPHYHACSGHARCTTCRVWVLAGQDNLSPRNEGEAQVAQKKNWPDEIRLACQTTVTGPVRLKRLVTDDTDRDLVYAEGDSLRPARESKLVVMVCHSSNLPRLITEQTPYDAIHLQNRFYKEIVEPILANQGEVDRYYNQEVIAFFGLKQANPTEVTMQAVRAGLHILSRLSLLNEYAKRHFNHHFELRIALHYGPLVVGGLWHPTHKMLSVLGDTVQVTRQIAAAASVSESPALLASATLFEWVKGQVRSAAPFTVRLETAQEPVTLQPITALTKPDATFLVQTTFERVAPRADEVAGLFYDELFRLDPSTKSLFRHTRLNLQRKMLMNMIGSAVRGLNQFDALEPTLNELGWRHAEGYHVKPEHYAIAGTALTNALERYFGAEFTPELRQAWDDMYQKMVGVMTAPHPGSATPALNDGSPQQILAQLQLYIPKALADKMRAIGYIEGERRQVTVIFADISGFTRLSERLDPEEVATLINEALKEMAAAVYQYEGYIDKFIGDAIMAVFGAPVAHEDDAERALHAALAMRERLQQFNRRHSDRLPHPLHLHIGINSGTVIAGNVGSDLRMSYTVMGDTVNTASRLESHAESGQILASLNTYLLTREAFAFDILPPITVKGKQEPLLIYELQQAKLQPGKSRGVRYLNTAFVGRDLELDRLAQIQTRLEAGEGHIVLLQSKAGLGKTRLLSEWRQTMGDRAQWLVGHALAYTTSLGYAPFLEMLRHQATLLTTERHAQTRDWLEATLADLLPGKTETQTLLTYLLDGSLSAAEQAWIDGLNAEAMHRQMTTFFTQFFEHLAHQSPTWLILEDVQWADANTLDLLQNILPLTERLPLALVIVGRIGEMPGSLVAHLHSLSGRLAELTLAPLSSTQTLSLITQLLTTDTLSPGVTDLIVDRAEGNPFFVEEVVRSLIDGGALVYAELPDDQGQTTNRWVPSLHLNETTVPDTLQGALMAKLDNLPAGPRWLAQQAAVIGRGFSYQVLQAVVETKSNVNADLAYLEQVGLIEQHRTEPEITYIFKQALIQEVAYQSLLTTRRKAIHHNVAQAIETLFADRLETHYPLISEHYLKAQVWDKALTFSLLAAEAAEQRDLTISARIYYQQALTCLSHLPDTPENRTRRTEILNARFA